MSDFPEVDWYRRSGGAPSADQSLVPSDGHHEMPRQRPVWLVLVFYALMIAVAVWLLATNTGGVDEDGVDGGGAGTAQAGDRADVRLR